MQHNARKAAVTSEEEEKKAAAAQLGQTYAAATTVQEKNHILKLFDEDKTRSLKWVVGLAKMQTTSTGTLDKSRNGWQTWCLSKIALFILSGVLLTLMKNIFKT